MKPLPYQFLSDVYLQLARLHKAGISHHEAIKQLSKLETPAAERARRASIYLNRGAPLPESGEKAKLFADADIALLEAADMSGNYTEIFQSLADTYAERARRQRRIRTQLGLPVIMLVLGVFIPPLPAIVRGDLALSDYLLNGLGILGLLTAVAIAVLYLPGVLRRNGAARLIDVLALAVPYFGHWSVRRQFCRFMQVLALLLRCGVPVLEALPKACAAVDNVVLRGRLEALHPAIEAGETLADALASVRGFNQQALAMARIGEHSGALDTMLQYYVDQEAEELAQHDSTVARRFPRIIYALVAGFIAYTILRGGAGWMPLD